MNLDEYAPSAARKILVYGPPKSGKTALAGKLAEIKRLHYFDGENSIKTLLNPDMLNPEFRKNITVYRMPDTQHFPVFADTLLKVLKGGDIKICHPHGVVSCPKCSREAPDAFTVINVDKFTLDDVLVLDSVSQLAASVMHRITAEQIKKDNNDYKPTWDDYYKQGFVLDRIFSITQAAPYNIVCISHEQLVEMENGKKKLVPIGGTSNFSKTFAKYFDDVVYCDIVNGKHLAASSSTYMPNIITGSRTGKVIEKDATNAGLKLLFA